MNVAVTYFSKTGNTKKVAATIAQAAGCDAVPITDFETGTETDLMFIGGAIYGGSLDPSLEAFLNRLDPKFVKRTALFSTCITEAKGIGQMKTLLQQKGIPVEGSFFCKGKFLFVNRHRPNDADLEQASEFVSTLTGSR